MWHRNLKNDREFNGHIPFEWLQFSVKIASSLTGIYIVWNIPVTNPIELSQIFDKRFTQ